MSKWGGEQSFKKDYLQNAWEKKKKTFKFQQKLNIHRRFTIKGLCGGAWLAQWEKRVTLDLGTTLVPKINKQQT